MEFVRKSAVVKNATNHQCGEFSARIGFYHGLGLSGLSFAE